MDRPLKQRGCHPNERSFLFQILQHSYFYSPQHSWGFSSVVSIPRQSRGLYGCWPLKGAWPQSEKNKKTLAQWIALASPFHPSYESMIEMHIPERVKLWESPGRAGGLPNYN